MKVYCLPEFKDTYQKLVRKNKYKNLQSQLVEHFFDNPSLSSLQTGFKLNGHATDPYIKRRIGGSGGFRLYYYVLKTDECVYLMFVHPKTGSMGGENVTNETKAMLLKKVIEAIKGEGEL